MKRYIAAKDDNGIFLTKDEQFDKALTAGCVILEIEDGQPERVIATPTEGFLEERPTLENSERIEIPMAAMLAMMKGE
ncbi:MAG: hypothetical protein E6124_04160 [Blautia producta]|uniref:hypothetical protein n=1 Tax=Blautia producta TaxID=33035 RepID=UPI002908B1A0|nr:hypothetical protein [Blautia producta]MDU5381373.1 hypothetical protein [Blautia producta]MDU6882446.1 hypothetical protein [Blautia producta]